MSLKALELQHAIPKTFDAGKLVDQHQQNVTQQQIDANEALKKEIRKKQLQVSDTEKTDKITDKKNQQQNRDDSSSEQKQHVKAEKEAKNARHPFKGNFIDFSG